MFEITNDAIDGNQLKSSLPDDGAGACVIFEGWVRNRNEGRQVERLEYEAYAVVAQKEGEKIMQEAEQKFQLFTAIAVHRVGTLEIGDSAVWIGVTSGHREESFDASRYIIDEIKKRVPIWKREHYIDGPTEWVGMEGEKR
jgi:molybdopterin synthase catalytic subunit